MQNERLCRLRAARIAVHKNLARLEPEIARARARLAAIEAEMHAIEPQLWLQPRRYKPNPIFARGELPRLALAVLREAGEPLPIRVIAVRVLAAKGITLPEPAIRKRVRMRLRTMFVALDKRGVTVRVGEGNAARRGLAAGSYQHLDDGPLKQAGRL